MYVYVYVFVCFYAVCIQMPMEARVDIGAGVIGVCSTSRECWELNSGPQQEQCMLLIIEPPFQPP